MKALVLICAYLWLAATVYMAGTHEPGPPGVIAFVLGVMVTIAVGVSHDAQREILEKRYAMFYGPAPPTGDIKGTRYGGAAGALLGHYVLGAVAGMVVDAFRESKQRESVTSEQRRMLDEIRVARAGSPAIVLLPFGFALLVSAIIVWL